MQAKNTRKSRSEEHPELRHEMEDHFDRVIAAAESLSPFDRVLLVGPNGSGKSVLRQLLGKNEDLRVVNGEKLRVCHASMDLRTANNASMGALSSMCHDTPWLATSQNTIHNVETAIRSLNEYLGRGGNWALHIDEPEIGFSEEVQMGTGLWLRHQIDAMPTPPTVTLVTTHSRQVAVAFEDWKLLDLGFKHTTVRSWIDRELVPSSPHEVALRAGVLFEVVRDRINAAKEKKANDR